MPASRKILLVQLFSNGDCLYVTTIARQIKTDFPGSDLSWAISKSCRHIIEGNTFVDSIIEINTVPKDDEKAFRSLKKEIEAGKYGIYSHTFITHHMGTNQALYDGTIRSALFRAYPFPVTVNVQPDIFLNSQEEESVKQFANDNRLQDYDHVVLFEFAPQSGQSKISKQDAVKIAEQIVSSGNTAVILTSGQKIIHENPAIIDASVLKIRENAALTHYCDLLLGTSSGITWLSTSSASKQLNMIQLLNAGTTWVNPISRDFQRQGLPVDHVIELVEFDKSTVSKVVVKALLNFEVAKEEFNQKVPLHFKTSRKIVYNLLVYGEFKAIAKHIIVNQQVFGFNINFYLQVIAAILFSPFTFIRNKIKKHKSPS